MTLPTAKNASAMNEILTWCAINALFATAVIGGVVFDVDGLMNIAAFSVWLLMVLVITTYGLLIAAGTNHDIRKRLDLQSGSNIPPAVEVGYDIAITAIFLFYGHFILATAYTIHLIFLLASRAQKKILFEQESEGL